RARDPRPPPPRGTAGRRRPPPARARALGLRRRRPAPPARAAARRAAGKSRPPAAPACGVRVPRQRPGQPVAVLERAPDLRGAGKGPRSGDPQPPRAHADAGGRRASEARAGRGPEPSRGPRSRERQPRSGGAARIDTLGAFGLAPARERRKNIALSRVAEGPARRSHSNRSCGTLVLIPTHRSQERAEDKVRTLVSPFPLGRG